MIKGLKFIRTINEYIYYMPHQRVMQWVRGWGTLIGDKSEMEGKIHVEREREREREARLRNHMHTCTSSSPNYIVLH